MNRFLYLFVLLPFLSCAQTIHIAGADTVCAGTSVHFTATTSGVASPHYRWQVNGVNTGADSSGLIVDSVANGDSVRCLLTDSLGAVLGTSNKIVMTVQHMPSAGVILGPSAVCHGSSITLIDTIPGGVWNASNDNATVVDGLVTGIAGGGYDAGSAWDSIYYKVINSCGVASTFILVSVDNAPHAGFFWGSPGDLDGPVCQGQSYPINDYDGVGGIVYSLYGNAGGSNDDVWGNNPGSDVLINVISNACGSDTARENITVLGDPVVSPIYAVSSNLCVGATLTLKDTSFGGFSWYSSNGHTTVSRGIVTGVSTGADTIILKVSNSCGSSQTSFSVTIDPPDSIEGEKSLCVGSKILLSDRNGGGTWSIDNSQIASIDPGGILYGVIDGFVVVSYSLAGCTVADSVAVKPLPPPIVTSEALCIGYSITLQDEDKEGNWQSSDSSIATIDRNGVVYGVYTGTTEIIYTSPVGCVAQKILTVNPLPPNITGVKNICLGHASLLADADIGGIWKGTDSNIIIVDSISGITYGTGVGDATITYTSNQGCHSSTTVTVQSCNEGMTIYPNPSNDYVAIYAYTNLYTSYAFIDMFGKLVLEGPLASAVTVLDVRFLPAGTYTITLYGDNKRYLTKFVKE